MKKTALLFVIIISQICFAQDYQTDFKKYFQANDTINQLKVLKEWNAKSPKDAELYTSYYNYHFLKSMVEVVTMSTEKPIGEGLVLRDSLNNDAGYLGSQINYNPLEIKKAFLKIDQGIKLFPNRLDMRFGKIYGLGKIKDWENFTSEIIKTIQYSASNNNEWTWTNNQKKEGGEKEFLLDIQTYQLQLYDTGNDNLLNNMREIANEVLKYYPNHVESLTNISLTYLIIGEYEKGIEPLLRAEKINPKDIIVLSNIAQGYKLQGNKQKAIEYYQKIVKIGDKGEIENAEQQILKLK